MQQRLLRLNNSWVFVLEIQPLFWHVSRWPTRCVLNVLLRACRLLLRCFCHRHTCFIIRSGRMAKWRRRRRVRGSRGYNQLLYEAACERGANNTSYVRDPGRQYGGGPSPKTLTIEHIGEWLHKIPPNFDPDRWVYSYVDHVPVSTVDEALTNSRISARIPVFRLCGKVGVHSMRKIANLHGIINPWHDSSDTLRARLKEHSCPLCINNTTIFEFQEPTQPANKHKTFNAKRSRDPTKVAAKNALNARAYQSKHLMLYPRFKYKR